jgi:hypothetical protein
MRLECSEAELAQSNYIHSVPGSGERNGGGMERKADISRNDGVRVVRFGPQWNAALPIVLVCGCGQNAVRAELVTFFRRGIVS